LIKERVKPATSVTKQAKVWTLPSDQRKPTLHVPATPKFLGKGITVRSDGGGALGKQRQKKPD